MGWIVVITSALSLIIMIVVLSRVNELFDDLHRFRVRYINDNDSLASRVHKIREEAYKYAKESETKLNRIETLVGMICVDNEIDISEVMPKKPLNLHDISKSIEALHTCLHNNTMATAKMIQVVGEGVDKVYANTKSKKPTQTDSVN